MVFDHSCALGLGGIVSKRADSIYTPGKRSKDWLKIQNSLEEDFLICGLVERKGELEALHVGKLREGTLSYAGKVERGLWNVSWMQPKERSRDRMNALSGGAEARDIMQVGYARRLLFV